MAETRLGWMVLRLRTVFVAVFLLLAFCVVSAEKRMDQGVSENNTTTVELESGYLWQNGHMLYQHVWPEMNFSWRIVAGTIIAFFAAAFGSVGGVGGGGIFVPMLTLIIGFDPKSSTAMSKCMITGAAGATVYYNLKLRHPTLDLPMIDYDLALLFQPMLVLGISIGVAFNVIFADWMVTVLLIILFAVTSTIAFFKGVEAWKKENIMKKEVARFLSSSGSVGKDIPYKLVPSGPSSSVSVNFHQLNASKVSIRDNVNWMEFCILVGVWGIILLLQVTKNYTKTCSVANWTLNLLQIPVAVGASAYEAIGLYKGKRVIASRGEAGTNWTVHQLIFCCFCGILAGIVGGLLGLGGGFILGPLFLELGVPPQVSSATATFAMTFSSSMSVVQYYLLKRFPVPYAVYFIIVATVAALVGQHVVRKMVSILGRASLIVFILAFTIFVSAISLGAVGIPHMVEKIRGQEYMGFDNICAYDL